MTAVKSLTPEAFKRAEALNDMVFEYGQRLRFAEHIRHALQDPLNESPSWYVAFDRAVEHCKPTPAVKEHVSALALSLFERKNRWPLQLAKATITTLKRRHRQTLKDMGVTR